MSNSRHNQRKDVSVLPPEDGHACNIQMLTVSQLEQVLQKWFFNKREDYLQYLETLLGAPGLTERVDLDRVIWEMMSTLVLKRVDDFICQTRSLGDLSRLLDELALRALFVRCNYLPVDDSQSIDLFGYKDILELYKKHGMAITKRVSDEISALSYLVYGVDVDIKSPEDYASLEAAEKIVELVEKETDLKVIECFYEKTAEGHSFSPWSLKEVFFGAERLPAPDFKNMDPAYLKPLQDFCITGASMVHSAAQKKIEDSLEACADLTDALYTVPLRCEPWVKMISESHAAMQIAIKALKAQSVLPDGTFPGNILAGHHSLVRQSALNYLALSRLVNHYQKIYRALWHAETGCLKGRSFFEKICQSDQLDKLEAVRERAEQFPHSRTAIALRLALKYQDLEEDRLADSMELVLDIYKPAFRRSFPLAVSNIAGRRLFFSKQVSSLRPADIQPRHLAEASTRTSRIVTELKRP